MTLGALLATLALVAACGGSEASHEVPSPVPTLRPLAPSATPAVEPSATPGSFRYTVEPGDTVSDIAQRFGTTVEEIVAANGLADPAEIAAGQVLIITNATRLPPPTPSPTPAPENPVGAGFQMPIAGACLPGDDYLMPGAPREYRYGIHEGVDFYTGRACTDVPANTPVLAAKAGRVVRADHNFVEMSPEELDAILARSQMQGYTDAKGLDRLRGRQVWIDHGNGVVTRYAHLAGIPEWVREGATVQAGDEVGYVGDSGTPEAVTNPGVEIHLHFEIRVGDSYLGAALPPDQVRYLYEQAFSSP